MRIFWLSLGLLSLGLGILGVALPLLPTVPFVLLSAFCFSRSSQRLHNWLINHPSFGPAIVDWRERRAISKKAKCLATASLMIVFAVSLIMQLRIELLLLQAVILSGVLVFMWTRPES